MKKSEIIIELLIIFFIILPINIAYSIYDLITDLFKKINIFKNNESKRINN